MYALTQVFVMDCDLLIVIVNEDNVTSIIRTQEDVYLQVDDILYSAHQLSVCATC